MHPVVIVGGGLAGCAAATVLAQAGWPVTIFEQEHFPRDKMCGEFLSGESRRILAELGCLDQILKHDPPDVTHARFFPQRGKPLVIQLPVPALGVTRRLLDDTLFRHACRAGAEGHEGAEVCSMARHVDGITLSIRRGAESWTVPAQTVLAAYGRRSKLDRDLDRPFLRTLSSHVGLKLHHTAAATPLGQEAMRALAHTTEIYMLDGGYCGVGLVEAGRINVCMLLTQLAFRRVGSADWPAVREVLGAQNPALAQRLGGLVPAASPVLTVSQMPFAKKDVSQPQVLFLGDAAGMIAPLCGDGQAMALESGVMAARHCMAHTDPACFEAEWQKIWSRRFSARIEVGRILQKALLAPAVGNAGIRMLRLLPARVPNYLARITRS